MISGGLTRVLADTPVRSGYLELQLGAVQELGAYAQLEAGYRPLERVGLFGFGRLEPTLGWSAGAGARWVW
jgi:hypothetical protein